MPRLTAHTLHWTPPALAAAVVLLTLWFHLGRSPLPMVPAAAPALEVQRSSAAPPALGEISGWALFGRANPDSPTPTATAAAGTPPPPATLEDLPPTTLGLTVSGIAYSPNATTAHAIIGLPDGRQQAFKPGETLLDGVTVHAIRPLEVIISNQGTLESVPLPLESVQTGQAAAPPLPTPVIPQIPTNPPGMEAVPGQPGQPGT